MNTLTDLQAMQRAYAMAEKAAACGEVPVGAIIVRDGEVLSEACNQPIATHDPSAHAEIIAMRRAGEALQNYRLNGCTLYVTLEPCAMCATAMVHARLGRCVFATWDEKAGAVASCQALFEAPWINHRVSWLSGVMAEPCSQLMQDFFARAREMK